MINHIINIFDPTKKITLGTAPSVVQVMTMGKYTLDYIIAIMAILIRKGVK